MYCYNTLCANLSSRDRRNRSLVRGYRNRSRSLSRDHSLRVGSFKLPKAKYSCINPLHRHYRSRSPPRNRASSPRDSRARSPLRHSPIRRPPATFQPKVWSTQVAAAPSTQFKIPALPAKASAPTPVSLDFKASSIFIQSAPEASTSTDEDAVYTADE
jgi:hypothetical protein